MSAATAAAIAGGIGAATSAGIGIAGAAGAFAPGAPSQVNFAQTTAADQAAQIANLPSALAASQAFDPQFAAVQQGINYQNLFGSPGTPQTTTSQIPVAGFINGKTGQFVAGSTNPGTAASFNYNAPGKQQPGTTQDWQPFTQFTPQTQTTQGPATPGSLAIAQQALPAINQLAANANTASRTATIGDVNTLGPQALAALRNFDPAQTQLADTLTQQAQSELAAGSQLTPSQIEQGQQNVRAGQAARGMGMGPTDVYTESFNLGQAGQAQLQQRQNFASNVINQQSQLFGDPFLAITGQSSGRNVNPGQFSTGGNSTVASALNPNAGLNIAQSNNQLANQAGIAGSALQNASLGALAGQGGNFGNIFTQILKGFGSGVPPTLTGADTTLAPAPGEFDPSFGLDG